MRYSAFQIVSSSDSILNSGIYELDQLALTLSFHNYLTLLEEDILILKSKQNTIYFRNFDNKEEAFNFLGFAECP